MLSMLPPFNHQQTGHSYRVSALNKLVRGRNLGDQGREKVCVHTSCPPTHTFPESAPLSAEPVPSGPLYPLPLENSGSSLFPAGLGPGAYSRSYLSLFLLGLHLTSLLSPLVVDAHLLPPARPEFSLLIPPGPSGTPATWIPSQALTSRLWQPLLDLPLPEPGSLRLGPWRLHLSD